MNRNWMRSFIIALLFIAPLIPFYLLDKQYDPLENAYQSDHATFQIDPRDQDLKQVENVSDDWRDYDISTDGATRADGYYRFRVTLPEKDRWRDPHLYVSHLRNGEFYLKGEQIYSFNTDLRYDQIFWNQPRMFPLPDNFAGEDLYIRSYFSQQWLYPGSLYIDGPQNLILKQTLDSSYRIALGFVSLLIAVTSLILYVSRRERTYLYFSMFSFVVVFACVILSWGLFSLIMPWPSLTYIYNIALLFGGYAFLRFFADVFGAGPRKAILRLCQATLFFLVVTIIAAIFAPVFYANEMSRFISYAVAPVVFGLITFSSIWTYRNNRDEESFWYMIGFVTFAIFTAYSFIRYEMVVIAREYAAPLLPFVEAITRLLYQNDRYLHSIFILMFCMTMILIRRIRNVYDEAKQTAAQLAEMTESLEQLVRERTAELEETNFHLRASMQETSQAIAEIAVLEDRNRIAKEMHDHIGYDLTAASIQIEAAKMLMFENQDLALQKLESTRNTINQGLSHLREIVRMMKEDYDERPLILILQELIQESRTKTGISIIYDPEPLPDLTPNMRKTIFHALQEGLTNGIRHGAATHFQFSLTADERCLHFQLSNNGRPYDSDDFGFGLNAMNERVKQLGGTLRIGDDDGEGCLLEIVLPYKDF